MRFYSQFYSVNTDSCDQVAEQEVHYHLSCLGWAYLTYKALGKTQDPILFPSHFLVHIHFQAHPHQLARNMY